MAQQIPSDPEKGAPAATGKTTLQCKPTVSVIDVGVDGTVQRHPRSLRSAESQYMASLPDPAVNGTRIFLREKDYRFKEDALEEDVMLLEMMGVYSQWGHQLDFDFFNHRDLQDATIARVFEASGAHRWWSIHRADRFDVSDLLDLLSPGNTPSQLFLAQLNFEASQIHKHAVLTPNNDIGLVKKTLHTGRFRGDTVYWERFSAMEVRRVDDGDRLEGMFGWTKTISFLF